MLLSIITSLHIFICVLLIILVLLQQGKGADAGVTFGGGGNTVFGASGADNFITRFTTILACCFMITSVYLGVESKPGSPAEGRLFKGVADSAPVVSPAVSSTAASSATSSPLTETSNNTEQPLANAAENTSASSAVAVSTDAASSVASQAASSEVPSAQ